MIIRQSMKKLIVVGLLLAVMNLTACGYFLYPERKGQTEGRLDSTVILLDAVGLLFFVVPGVVAFAVDIATGAIYLPKGGKSVIDKHIDQTRVETAPHADVDKTLLAAKLSANLNRPITPEMIQFYGATPNSPGAIPMEATVLY
ncbi:hypothetical protein DSLASN_20820 [Desulfoluna limicola]|uniref:Uncharacterized protein n=1 Tax=Desulfoluna limicola TaxID=2810562 RepID=A0ABM7PFT2_9BACT|nr:hypothetical protein [Desulfoluna limicola]BCS96450.1 hypothetical protein DSLASN_20820 [Desulfoluna limicola]